MVRQPRHRAAGDAFAGGLVLDDPQRFAGTAILYGTLPFEAGVPTTPGRLDDVAVFVAQGDDDHVIPRELLDRTWAYLHDTSGADLRAERAAGGHGITPQVLTTLGDWLTDVTAPQEADA